MTRCVFMAKLSVSNGYLNNYLAAHCCFHVTVRRESIKIEEDNTQKMRADVDTIRLCGFISPFFMYHG